MQWNKRRFDGKAKESIFDDKDLYPKKPRRRLSKKTIQQRREKRRVEKLNIAAERTRQKLVLEAFAWKDE